MSETTIGIGNPKGPIGGQPPPQPKNTKTEEDKIELVDETNGQDEAKLVIALRAVEVRLKKQNQKKQNVEDRIEERLKKVEEDRRYWYSSVMALVAIYTTLITIVAGLIFYLLQNKQ